MLLETSLLEEGHEVRCAENGKAGERLAGSWHPDLVFMDLEMPVMDGIPTIYILREKGCKGKIAVISGNLSDENKNKAGANHFFSRPFQDDPDQMVAKIFNQKGSPSTNSLTYISLNPSTPSVPNLLLHLQE
jgi:CheY-like chemotaxis protein